MITSYNSMQLAALYFIIQLIDADKQLEVKDKVKYYRPVDEILKLCHEPTSDRVTFDSASAPINCSDHIYSFYYAFFFKNVWKRKMMKAFKEYIKNEPSREVIDKIIEPMKNY